MRDSIINFEEPKRRRGALRIVSRLTLLANQVRLCTARRSIVEQSTVRGIKPDSQKPLAIWQFFFHLGTIHYHTVWLVLEYCTVNCNDEAASVLPSPRSVHFHSCS